VSGRPGAPVDLVVKIGGGLLAEAAAFDAVMETVSSASRGRRLLIVPGGGPFAGAVRAVDRERRVPDTTAHWMAILGMDQYAHLLAAQLEASVIVRTPGEIRATCERGGLPILAPFSWLRDADPLPHSWDVSSDSLAAWIVGALGAAALLLVKPPHAAEPLVDAGFGRVVPLPETVHVLTADRLGDIRRTLEETGAARRLSSHPD
jgi:5-(aminomethyl)-3-furanmethanol phosphate kinase